MSLVPKITVLGGSGFVGTNFCQILSDREIPFEIIDIQKSRRFPDFYKYGDVRDIASLIETVSGDVVVNLAAVHRDDITDTGEYYRTNVGGAENIAEVCRRLDIRKIIFTSSVAVYGFAAENTSENGVINPFNDYGKSKFQAEQVFRDWQAETDCSLIVVRPTVIFGEGNRGNVFNLLNQIAKRRFTMIGNGSNKKSMAYIANVVSFLMSCTEADMKIATFNYVDDPDLNMNQLVSLSRKELFGKAGTGVRLPYSLGLSLGYIADFVTFITKKKLPISSIRVKKFCGTTSFSSAKSELSEFVPPFTLSEALKKTIAYEFLENNQGAEVFFTE